MNRLSTRLLGAFLALVLSGVAEPALLLAQRTSPAPPVEEQQAAPESQGQSSPDAQQPSQTPDRQGVEDKASQEIINRNHLPDSPGTRKTQSTQEAAPATAAQQPQAPRNVPVPSGTAAAQAGKVSGNAASRPAGVAIAPAKQRQVRSLLIKLGVIAGAGVAIGAVAALSQASPAKPPGSH
jgi:cytoskeletal protein RodZ